MEELQLEIPVDLSSITLRQYQDYLKIYDKWDKEDEIYIKSKMLQVFCGLKPEDTLKVPLASFDNTIQHLLDCLNADTPFIRKFSMKGKDKDGNDAELEFGFIPKLDEISFGEFIDLEKYMSDWQTMHKAMAVLFRPIIHSKKEFYRIDDYGGSARYSDVMLDMPVSVAIGATVFFLSFREQITSSYDGLFTGGTEERGSDSSSQANFGRKWGWYQSVYGIAKGDVTKFNNVTKLNVHECLMYLAFRKR